jgi:hypothetical protein
VQPPHVHNRAASAQEFEVGARPDDYKEHEVSEAESSATSTAITRSRRGRFDDRWSSTSRQGVRESLAAHAFPACQIALLAREDAALGAPGLAGRQSPLARKESPRGVMGRYMVVTGRRCRDRGRCRSSCRYIGVDASD